MKKSLLLFLILTFISLQTNAQKGEDALYLKNGSIVFGKIMEVKDNMYKIKTVDGFLFNFSAGEVEKFTLAAKSEPTEIKISDPDGFGFGIESGMLVGSSDYNFPLLFAFNPMVTYTIANSHTLGFVTGTELYDAFYLPLTFEYRFRIIKKNVSPFMYVRGGALVPLGGTEGDEDYKGGWTIGGGTGFRWPIKDFESYIKFGYRYGYLVHTEENTYYSTFPVKYTYHANFYRLEMKWGFKF
ncbi:MAG: hypothetical protein MUF36_06410 [Bacteroidales bacterium]|jgi:hypothetical protein|nr:hypothetical protein [Bacteroidales bacterium]